MARIRFFSESIDFSIPRPLKVTRWIKDVINKEGFVTGDLNFIFCDDDGLLEINVDFLDHDTYTDIITFDNSEEEGVIEGDIFISVDRIKENAANLLLPFEDELHRVMIHGVLHLMGYKDKRPEDKKAMREKEDACLELRNVPRGT